MSSKKNVRVVDEFSKHELLDRISVLNVIFCDHISKHPWTKEDPEIKAQVEAIVNQLSELYQVVGAKRFAE